MELMIFWSLIRYCPLDWFLAMIFFTKMPVSKMTLSAKIALDGNKVLIGAGKQSDLACIVRNLSQSYLEIRGSNVQLNSE